MLNLRWLKPTVQVFFHLVRISIYVATHECFALPTTSLIGKRSRHVGVSENRGLPPKSSILIGASIINHPFWGKHHYFWKHPCTALKWNWWFKWPGWTNTTTDGAPCLAATVGRYVTIWTRTLAVMGLVGLITVDGSTFEIRDQRKPSWGWLVVWNLPVFTRVLAPSQVVVWIFFHQSQYERLDDFVEFHKDEAIVSIVESLFFVRKRLDLPSRELTWQWKIPMFNREYIFRRSIFYCHVSLPEGIFCHSEGCFWFPTELLLRFLWRR